MINHHHDGYGEDDYHEDEDIKEDLSPKALSSDEIEVERLFLQAGNGRVVLVSRISLQDVPWLVLAITGHIHHRDCVSVGMGEVCVQTVLSREDSAAARAGETVIRVARHVSLQVVAVAEPLSTLVTHKLRLGAVLSLLVLLQQFSSSK